MASLTLKNVPPELYDRLRQTAQKNRRSLNSEAIVQLEKSLLPTLHHDEEELMRRIRERRSRLNLWVTDDFINKAKSEGRP